MLQQIEVSGKTESEAIERALQQLQMDRDEVSVEILKRLVPHDRILHKTGRFGVTPESRKESICWRLSCSCWTACTYELPSGTSAEGCSVRSEVSIR